MVVIAVVEAALLAAVDLVVGRVDVQHEPGRPPPLPGVDERLEQHGLQRVRIVFDLVVAARLATRGRVFEPVQSALPRQWGTVLPMSLELAGKQGQNRVVPQLVVVVEVFVSQGDAHDALPHQRPDRVFRETGIAVVGEAIRHPVQESDRPVDLAKQQHSGVRRDRSAVERGRYPAALAPLKYEGKRLTLCRYRSSGVVAVKLCAHINLTAPGGRCLLIGVRNPG